MKALCAIRPPLQAASADASAFGATSELVRLHAHVIAGKMKMGAQILQVKDFHIIEDGRTIAFFNRDQLAFPIVFLFELTASVAGAASPSRFRGIRVGAAYGE